MMSERSINRSKKVEVNLTWEDIFLSIPLLMEQTAPDDVRWCHVERMKRYHDQMLAKYESKGRSARRQRCYTASGTDANLVKVD